MNEWGDIVKLGIVYGVLKIVDYLLPGGRRFRVMDRWTVENEKKEQVDEP